MRFIMVHISSSKIARYIFGELLKLVIETYFDEKIALIFLESSYVFDQVKRSEDFLVHFDSHGIVRRGSTASSIWADSITSAHRAKRQKAQLVHYGNTNL